MIRNPKDFGVWSACPSGVHSLITKLEMFPIITLFPPLNKIRLRSYFLSTLTLPLTLASSRSGPKG